MASISITIALILVGISIGVVTYLLGRMFLVVPDENRRYLDRPPLAFRIIWPLIRVFVFYFSPIISKPYRKRTLSRLRRGGMDFSVSPEQFLAAKIYALIIFAIFGYWVSTMIELNPAYLSILFAFLGFTYPDSWINKKIKERERAIFRALPFYLDIITLSEESGTNLLGAFNQAYAKAPEGPLKDEVGRLLRDIKTGKPRIEALKTFADRIEMSSVNSLISSIVQSERVGSSLGNILRAQADQRRHERFALAEKMGMEAPVKLLGPLVMFIFPTTFLVISFLIFVKIFESGMITNDMIVWAMTNPG